MNWLPNFVRDKREEIEEESEGQKENELKVPEDDDETEQLSFIGLSKKAKDDEVDMLIRICNSLRKNTSEQFSYNHYRSTRRAGFQL